jgi:hypothetical protein
MYGVWGVCVCVCVCGCVDTGLTACSYKHVYVFECACMHAGTKWPPEEVGAFATRSSPEAYPLLTDCGTRIVFIFVSGGQSEETVPELP